MTAATRVMTAGTRVRRRLAAALAVPAAPVAAAAPAAASPPAGDPFASPVAVMALQRLLNSATSQRLVVDGVLGTRTVDAVRFLQKRLDLPVTGTADPLTLVLALGRVEDNHRRRHSSRRFLLPLPVPPTAAAPARRRQLLVDVPHQMFIGKVLDEGGGLGCYEPETLACFLAALDRKPTGTVLDVGANIGVFSMLAAALTDWRVIGFEPTPDLARAARRLADANSLDYTIEEVALGRETGPATFYLSNVTDASNSLAIGFRPSSTSLVVPVERLDEWAARSGVVPDLIKIDTETTEPDVLAGAASLLRTHRPWLLCEVLPGHREGDLLRELEPLGYTWHHIQDGKPLVASEQFQTAGPDRNWLLTPEPLPPGFQAEMDAWRAALDAVSQPVAGD